VRSGLAAGALGLPVVVTLLVAGDAAAAPNDFVARPLVLARGQLEAQLVLDLNLAPGYFGKSTSLAPDVWFGALPELTVGLIHSQPSVDRFAPGATFCIVHQDVGCQSTYHGSGVDARYSVLDGDVAVAPRLRVLVRELDPVKPAVTLGALVRWTRGRFAIIGDPYLQLGLANTDRGNRHALFLPVTFAVQPLARWELSLRTGFHSDLAVIRDGYHIPIALATRVAAQRDPHVDVGVMLAFASLLGPQNTAKERALFFWVAYRT
jgi:hypothetical protein